MYLFRIELIILQGHENKFVLLVRRLSARDRKIFGLYRSKRRNIIGYSRGGDQRAEHSNFQVRIKRRTAARKNGRIP